MYAECLLMLQSAGSSRISVLAVARVVSCFASNRACEMIAELEGHVHCVKLCCPVTGNTYHCCAHVVPNHMSKCCCMYVWLCIVNMMMTIHCEHGAALACPSGQVVCTPWKFLEVPVWRNFDALAWLPAPGCDRSCGVTVSSSSSSSSCYQSSHSINAIDPAPHWSGVTV
jgi:hypothetical protein